MRGRPDAASVTVLLYRVLNNCLVLTQLAYSCSMAQQVALLPHPLFDDFLEVVITYKKSCNINCVLCRMHELQGLIVLAWAMFTRLYKLLLLHWAYDSAVSAQRPLSHEAHSYSGMLQSSAAYCR